MKLERHDGVGILFIDTPRKNAINVDSIRESHALMDEAELDPGIRALVVTSSHKSIFCPGVDLPSLLDKSVGMIRSTGM
jgi:enoyl-CoA hydratase/carnithine racemase